MTDKIVRVINLDSLLPEQALAVVNERFKVVVESGKYAAWDWLDTQRYSRQDILDKIDRHLTQRRMGKLSDEDGSHAAAIVANGLMLLEYEIQGLGVRLGVEDMAKNMYVGRRDCCVKDQYKSKEAPDDMDGNDSSGCGSRDRTQGQERCHKSDGS